MSTATLYLLIAAAFQIGWLYNMKFLDKNKIKMVRFNTLTKRASLLALLPILLYLIFGITNVTFLTLAMQTIPASTVYAIWTGLVLGVAALIDRFFFKQTFHWSQYVFLCMIAIGIIGLKSLATT